MFCRDVILWRLYVFYTKPNTQHLTPNTKNLCCQCGLCELTPKTLTKR